jgi:hypothetical protein
MPAGSRGGMYQLQLSLRFYLSQFRAPGVNRAGSVMVYDGGKPNL